MKLKHASAFALVESVNGDDYGSKDLGISHLHAVGLYTAKMKKRSILIRVTSNLVQNVTKSAPFHALIFYTCVTTFMRS